MGTAPFLTWPLRLPSYPCVAAGDKQALEKDKLELLADANASKARADALEKKFSAARVRLASSFLG